MPTGVDTEPRSGEDNRLILPENVDWYFLRSDALAELGRPEQAEAILAEGMGRFPDHLGLAIHHSWMAMGRAEWTEAAGRWEAIRDRFPHQPIGYYEGGLALREAGRLDEADAVLVVGIQKFPDNVEVLRHYALNAHRRRLWAQALTRWQDVLARFPDDAIGKLELQCARYEAQLDALEDPNDAPAGVDKIGWSDMETRAVTSRENDADLMPSELFMRFESLGDNCEFGFVQRHFGAGPLSLFRWGATTIDMLTSALDADLNGIGKIGHTTVSTYPSGELVLHDNQYFSSMHTHFHRESVNIADFLSEMCVRLQFLKKRIIETLKESE